MLANEARVGGQPFLTAGGCWKNSVQMSLRRLTSYAGWECPSENLMRVMRLTPASRLFGSTQKGLVIFRYSNQLMQVMNPSDPDTAAFYDAYYKLSRRLFDTDKVRRFRLEVGRY